MKCKLSCALQIVSDYTLVENGCIVHFLALLSFSQSLLSKNTIQARRVTHKALCFLYSFFPASASVSAVCVSRDVVDAAPAVSLMNEGAPAVGGK